MMVCLKTNFCEIKIEAIVWNTVSNVSESLNFMTISENPDKDLNENPFRAYQNP